MTDTEKLIEEARRAIETPAERQRRMTRERVRRWRARLRQKGESTPSTRTDAVRPRRNAVD